MSVKMQITLPDPPEGYEYTGEVRPPIRGDFYLYRDRSCKCVCDSIFAAAVAILKKKTWRAPRTFAYFMVNDYGEVEMRKDFRNSLDDKLFNNRNYFQERYQAEHAAIKLKAILEEVNPA